MGRVPRITPKGGGRGGTKVNVEKAPVVDSAEEIREPDWRLLLDDDLEIQRAHLIWTDCVAELKSQDRLGPAQRHQLENYVIVCIMEIRALQDVMQHGLTLKAPRGAKIIRTNPLWAVAQQAAATAEMMASGLTLTVKTRGSGGKVNRRAAQNVAAAKYLTQRA